MPPDRVRRALLVSVWSDVAAVESRSSAFGRVQRARRLQILRHVAASDYCVRFPLTYSFVEGCGSK